jgi:hypothetical protein
MLCYVLIHAEDGRLSIRGSADVGIQNRIRDDIWSLNALTKSNIFFPIEFSSVDDYLDILKVRTFTYKRCTVVCM